MMDNGEDMNMNSKKAEMDYGRGFRFVFADKEWVSKLLLGILISLVPIFNFVLAGYSLEVMRRVSKGKEGLPKWSENLATMFIEGFMVLILQLSYYLPAIILVVAGLMFFGVFGAMFAFGSGVVVAVVLFAVAGLVGLAAILMIPTATFHYAKSRKLADAYKLRVILRDIKLVLGEYLMSGVIVVGISFGASFALGPIMVAPLVGPVVGYFLALAVSVYIGWVGAHYLGQLYVISNLKRKIKGNENGKEGV